MTAAAFTRIRQRLRSNPPGHRPIASGRMSVEYALQSLSGWFGRDCASRSARVGLRFLVPVTAGGEVSVHGVVTYVRQRIDGTAVNLEPWIENQVGRKVAVGTGSVVLPAGSAGRAAGSGGKE